MGSTIPSSQNTSPQPSYLDWRCRPHEIQERINLAFKALRTQLCWGMYNGSSSYNLHVDQHRLMQKIIQQADKEQTEFYVLDIGAGNFQWITALAKFLNEQQASLPKGVKVHIIGVRGEPLRDKANNPLPDHNQQEVTETGICYVHKIGAFKVEEISKALEEQNLHLQNKIDFIVSQWTLRHLVDPAGTYLQTYQLLRPEKGFLLSDGFFFYTQEQDALNSSNSIEFARTIDSHLVQLLLDTGATFVKIPQITRDTHGIWSNRFLVKRSDVTTSTQPPIQYLPHLFLPNTSDKELFDTLLDSQAGCVTQFRRTSKAGYRESQIPRAIGDFDTYFGTHNYQRIPGMAIFGDKKLYESLRQNHLLGNPSSILLPILQSESTPVSELHKAVLEGNIERTKECLTNGANVNESDNLGNTPLHYAVQYNRREIFELLLENQADPTLFNVYGHTPLHYAIMYNASELTFFDRLLFAKEPIETIIQTEKSQRSKECATPLPSLLDCAIDFAIKDYEEHITANPNYQGNIQIVERLLRSNAAMSSQNLETLQKHPLFQQLRNSGLVAIPPPKRTSISLKIDQTPNHRTTS